MKNVIALQHNEIKASFNKILHMVGYNVSLYKRLVDFVSKHALMHIAEEFDRVKHVSFDSVHCGCVLKRTHFLPCTCELARYDLSIIPLNEVHVM